MPIRFTVEIAPHSVCSPEVADCSSLQPQPRSSILSSSRSLFCRRREAKILASPKPSSTSRVRQEERERERECAAQVQAPLRPSWTFAIQLQRDQLESGPHQPIQVPWSSTLPFHLCSSSRSAIRHSRHHNAKPRPLSTHLICVFCISVFGTFGKEELRLMVVGLALACLPADSEPLGLHELEGKFWLQMSGRSASRQRRKRDGKRVWRSQSREAQLPHW